MSFRLHAAESAPEGIQRIASEQIDAAVQELGDRGAISIRPFIRLASTASASAPCCVWRKRILAGLMVRKTVAFATSRGLCDVRDVAVVIEVIDKLHAECKDQRETDLLYSARNVLVARRQQVAAGEQGLSAQAAQAADALSEAAERVASWPLATPGFDLLGPGIQKTYAKSRKAFTKAYREPSELAFTRYTRVLSIIGIKCTSLATSGRIGSAPIVGLLNHCLTS